MYSFYFDVLSSPNNPCSSGERFGPCGWMFASGMEPFEVSFQLSPSFLDNFHHFLGSEIMLTCFVAVRREGFITDLPESSVHQLFRRSSSRVAAASCWSCFFCVSLVFSQVFLLLELSRVRGASSLARPGCLWSSCFLLASGESTIFVPGLR